MKNKWMLDKIVDLIIVHGTDYISVMYFIDDGLIKDCREKLIEEGLIEPNFNNANYYRFTEKCLILLKGDDNEATTN